MVHCHVKLVCGRDDLMMINYFRDRLEDEFKFNQQLKVKVEVDLLRFLSCRNDSKTNALTFYRDVLSLYPNKVNLFKHSFLYAHLANLLRDPLESLPNKSIVLELICLIINYPQFCKKLTEPSTNLIGEVVRLMIEPVKTHASHDEYKGLEALMWMIGKALEENSMGTEMVSTVDGGPAVLKHCS